MTRTELTPYPISVALSPQAWVDGLCRELLASAVRPLWAFLESSRPRCLFLGGSAALGEAIGVSIEPSRPGAGTGDAPRRVLLSDLDLGIITERPAATEERRRLAELLRRLAEPILARHGAVYRSAGGTRCPLVPGLYEARALATQRPTLGLLDAAQRGLVLWGDPRGPAHFSVPAPESVPAFEAWRLVGNRAVERLAVECGPDRAPEGGWIDRMNATLRLHVRAKMAAGLWTARLVLHGRYRVGWRARARLLDEAGVAQPDDSLVRCAAYFRRFLEEGSAPEPMTEPAQQRLLAVALRRWLAESRGTGPPAADGGDGGWFPEAGFFTERLPFRERYRCWKLEESRLGKGRGGVFAWRALRRAFDPAAGTPEARRFAAATLFWRLFGEGADSGDRAPAGPSDLAGEATTLWEMGSRRILGEPVAAGPDLARRLLERLGLGAGAGSPTD